MTPSLLDNYKKSAGQTAFTNALVSLAAAIGVFMLVHGKRPFAC
jgi:hypothetical protein